MGRHKKATAEVVDEQPEITQEPAPAPEVAPEVGIVKLESRVRCKRMFLADSTRDARDQQTLRAELRKPKYRDRIRTVTTVKHYEPVDGSWLTEFEIETK